MQSKQSAKTEKSKSPIKQESSEKTDVQYKESREDDSLKNYKSASKDEPTEEAKDSENEKSDQFDLDEESNDSDEKSSPSPERVPQHSSTFGFGIGLSALGLGGGFNMQDDAELTQLYDKVKQSNNWCVPPPQQLIAKTKYFEEEPVRSGGDINFIDLDRFKF